MAVVLEYTEEEAVSLPKEFFVAVVEQTIRDAFLREMNQEEIRVSLVMMTEENMRRLNRTYRQKDAVTDVLSFGEYTKKILKEKFSTPIFLGEIFFCPAFIEKAAKEDGVTVKREMAYIVSHGVLHLLGFDHEEEMFVIQERVTDKIATL
ncbi:MAG: rRNA maturation RNase YbeY [Candidatus Moranbacteria bacterium]|nr:rRNA maturation RNase YbeY [Candidatus Moranbacteria bacterium]